MQNIKDIGILKSLRIEHVGERICETCNAPVPIYQKDGEEISKCMNCENINLSTRETEGYEPPKRRSLVQRVKAIEYIPDELEDVTFEDYVPKTGSQKQAKQLVLDFLKGDYKALLFQGDPGTGKSHLFRCAARELSKQKINWEENGRIYQVNKTVLFAKVPELMKLIQSTYRNRNGLNENTILKTITNADVLILDEIAGERSKADSVGFETWSGDILYQILDHRQGKANLYNLNYQSAEVKEKYGITHGKRILSRMSSQAKILKVEGPDHRMQGVD
ncbi:AAA family ATPase [Virgibacillus oceani]|uniref:DNA replication protein DnaC n=1 Tax=Virgibacillus oceani TaxID=1479511 RepID=A0A917H1N1_9BACI|nr:AAA family ATPase [Virgibacillus oceani]GGG64553.1 DNA replication protein DnaC [Virgibacillus oceani]